MSTTENTYIDIFAANRLLDTWLDPTGKIVSIVERVLSERSDCAIYIQRISELSGFDFEAVEKVFFVLLLSRYLKATFFPCHLSCGNAIGKQEYTPEIVTKKAYDSEYNCPRCLETITDTQDIEIQIVFWKREHN